MPKDLRDLLLGACLLAAACGREPAGAPPDAPPDTRAEARAEASERLREAKRLVRGGHAQEAADELRRALSLDPSLPEANLLLGRALVYLSDVLVGTRTRDQALVAEAIEALERATEQAPDDAEAAFWLGQAVALGERMEEAALHLTRATALDPAHGPARKALGVALGELGREDEARAQLEAAIELLPDDADAWARYGFQLELSGDVSGARASYERSVALDWSVPGTYSRLATVLRRAGDAQGATEAVRAFREWMEYGTAAREALLAAKAAPTDPGAVLPLAELYLSADLHERAVPWLERLLRLESGHARAEELLETARAGADTSAEGRFRLPRQRTGSAE